MSQTPLLATRAIPSIPITGTSIGSDPTTTGSPGGNTTVEADLTELYALIAGLGPGGGLPWFDVTDAAYGAVGDGTTDDTTAINAAHAAFNTAGGGVLYYPRGVGYKATGALTTLTAPGLVLGDGGYGQEDGSSGVSRILFDSQTAVCFTTTSPGLSFLRIGGVNTYAGTPSAGSFIHATDSRRALYDGVYVLGFYDNIDIENSAGYGDSWRMTGCHIEGPVRYGLRMRATFNVDAGDASISDCWFGTHSYDADAAIRIESGGGVKIVNSKINMNAAGTKRYNHGIDLAVASGAATSILLVTNTSIENVRGDGIHGTVGSGDSWKHIEISGNQFGLFGSNTTGKSISLVATASGGFNDIVIGPNSHVTSSGARTAIQLTNCDNVLVMPQVVETFNGPFTATTCTNLRDYTGGVAGVSISGTPTAGQVPVASSGTAAAWGDAASALTDLTDVTITTVASGDDLRWNGSAWVNSTGFVVIQAPTPTVAAGPPFSVTIVSVWGIDGSGTPYYNPANVTSGEEAALCWDPMIEEYALVSCVPV